MKIYIKREERCREKRRWGFLGYLGFGIRGFTGGSGLVLTLRLLYRFSI